MRTVKTHVERLHAKEVHFKDKAKHVGICYRLEPNGTLVCFMDGCNHEDRSLASMQTHLKGSHKLKSITPTFYLWENSAPVPAPMVPTSTNPDSPSSKTSEDTESDNHSGRSQSVGIGSRRVSRSTSRHFNKPYMRVNTNLDRPSRAVSSSSSCDVSPIGRGRSALRSATTPAHPSPLTHVIFSRPASRSPTLEQDSVSSDQHTDAIDQRMDMVDDETEQLRQSISDMLHHPTVSSTDSCDMEKANILLRKFGLVLFQIPFSNFPPQHLLICVICKKGISLSHAFDHPLMHHIKKRTELKHWLDENMTLWNLQTANTSISLPTRPIEPLYLLEILNGFKCDICQYLSTSKDALRKHIQSFHKNIPKASSSSVLLQTFFKQHPRYFEVLSLDPIDSEAIVHAYLSDVEALPAFKKSADHILVPKDVNDVGPLLASTEWHIHFHQYLDDRSKIRQIVQLMKVPTKNESNAWLGSPLYDVVKEYMADFKKKTSQLGLAAKCMLTTYPRVSHDDEAFAVVGDKSEDAYGLVVRKWTIACLRSLHPKQDDYSIPLNDTDKQYAQSLVDALQTNDIAAAIPAFHNFIKNLFYPRTPTSNKWNDPFECLFAVYSLKEGGTFASAQASTHPLAALKYFIRGIMIHEAFNNIDSFDGNITLAIEQEAKKNVVPMTSGAYNACCEHSRFISALAYGSTRPPTTMISVDEQSVTHQGKKLRMSDLREGLQRLQEDLFTEILDLTLGFEKKIIDPQDLQDDWSNDEYGYTWLKQHRFLHDDEALFKALLVHPIWRLGTISNQKFTIDSSCAWHYLDKSRQVLNKLFFYTFCTAGQTPRINEFVDYQIENGIRPRHFFWDNGRLWVATRRTKTETQTRTESFLPMKCHEHLSHLLKIYFLLIRPVETRLVFFMHGQEATQISKQYMWVHGGDRISDDDGYQLISRLTNAYFGVELGTREYRHITVAIGRMYLGNEAEMDDEEMDAIAAQAGHSAGIARSIYAVEAGRLPTMTSDKLRRFARASEKWAEVLGLVPGVPAMLPLERRLASRDNTYSTSTVGGNDQSVPAIGFDVNFLLAKLQATIVQEVQELAPPPSRPSTLPVEAMHENNDLDDMYLISDNEEENMDPFNDYNSSDLSSLGPSPPPPPRVASRYEEDVGMSSSPPSVQMHMSPPQSPTQPTHRRTDIAQLGLPQTQRDPLPPNLTVLLTQEFMVNLLKQHFPNIPNPVFKSPEQEERFNLRYHDKLISAKSIGIPAVQWTSTSRPPAAENQIIFVALETATGHGFMSYWKGQESRVVRLVIDEAHLMLTQSSFRANFSKLCQLAQFPVQKIYLSASLPPRLMPHFLRHAALPSSTNIVRARADQPNISYNVVKYTSMETEKPLEVAILIAKFLESGYMEEDQLGMIFCTSKREVEWLHTNFTLCSSHSDQMLEERARNEGLWKTSTHRWIASTTVLMQGIDSPRVGAVIFVKIPFGAMNIYQGAGRGGRDGRTSWGNSFARKQQETHNQR
ncbi:hypothetical protein D9613_006448 [Agrocybe pediades]|uniref:DNA 3'-5' helicase n=1 Tax=Agrocybe pediades TaxID=84607 RepID=A0A8H4VNU4_9AGAR|nr:hypothetical protein D9613_006448 [Agrocybe pediades]